MAPAEREPDHLRPRGLDFVRRRDVRVRRPRDCRDLDDLRFGAPPGGYGDAAGGGDSRNGRGPIPTIAGGDPARLRTDWAILAALVCVAFATRLVPLTFSPVAVLLFLERRDARKRALSVVLLLFLAFLHPLTTLLTLGMTSALVVLAQRRAIARGRFSLRSVAVDVATGPALAIPGWAYYSAVA